MAPQVRQHPGARPTERTLAVDEKSLAHAAHNIREEQASEQQRSCFYCLEGWVFLGSIGHDGEEVLDAIRCRRCCKGTRRIDAAGDEDL